MKSFLLPVILILAGVLTLSAEPRSLLRVINFPDSLRTKGEVVEVVNDMTLILADSTQSLYIQNNADSVAVIEKNAPSPHVEYFVVFQYAASESDIAARCTILDSRNGIFFVKVTPQQREQFFALPIEKMTIHFKPYRFLDTIPAEMRESGSMQRNSVIQMLVGQVNQDSLRSYVKALESQPTRTAKSNSKSVEWLVNKCKQLGADSVFTQPVPGYKENVIAILYGKAKSPNKYCMIGGHFDAVVAGPPAAGADDNASGTAATLEALRVFANSAVEHEETIRFGLWNAEETGLNGSNTYATAAKAAGHTIVGGYLNYDMIGYKKTQPTLCLHYKSSVAGSKEMGTKIKQLAVDYLKFENVVLTENQQISGSSDHAPFWSAGFPAIFGIEGKDMASLCPNYHKPGDLLDNAGGLNCSELMTIATQCGVAYLATYASVAKPIGIISSGSSQKSGIMARFTGEKVLNISLEGVLQGEQISCTMTDCHGRTVFQQKNPKMTANSISLDIPSVARGVYTVTVQTKSGAVFSTKVIR